MEVYPTLTPNQDQVTCITKIERTYWMGKNETICILLHKPYAFDMLRHLIVSPHRYAVFLNFINSQNVEHHHFWNFIFFFRQTRRQRHFFLLRPLLQKAFTNSVYCCQTYQRKNPRLFKTLFCRANFREGIPFYVMFNYLFTKVKDLRGHNWV